MKIICISGKAQHGKDTTAQYLKELWEEAGRSVLILHQGDLLKFICQKYFAWNGEKDEAGRELLQTVGTDIVRKQNPDFWADFTDYFLSLFPYQWDYVLIPDCRFPNEIKKHFDLRFEKIHLRVIRSPFESPLTETQQQHKSETALDESRPNLYLFNSGTLDELEYKTRGLGNWILSYKEGEGAMRISEIYPNFLYTPPTERVENRKEKEEEKQMVTLYTTGCPKCNVLKQKLQGKNIAFIVNDSKEQMTELGIKQVPVLKVGQDLLYFAEANDWVNKQNV